MKETREAVAETSNLSKKYGLTVALDGVDIKFPQGELTALIGPNGSGKTTLLKILAGLTYPDQGWVRTIERAPDRINKERFAFLPENDYLYSWMKLEYLIEFFARQYTSFDRSKAYQMTKDMNLKPEQKISDLSKGMRARFKLVLSLSRNVPLYILDEPLAGIDPQSRSYILENLNLEFARGESSVILSTHEVLESEKFFDYVIMLGDGRVQLEGYADDLRREHDLSLQELTREVFA